MRKSEACECDSRDSCRKSMYQEISIYCVQTLDSVKMVGIKALPRVCRALFFFIVFLLCCASILIEQHFLFEILNLEGGQRQKWINHTKIQFVTLLVFITSMILPSNMNLTYEVDSIPDGDIYDADSKGNFSNIMNPNSVIISNHQIYVDWLYIWFLSCVGNLGDSVLIMLKDLSRIPGFGYGMKLFNFMFLSRKWNKDKVVLTNQLLLADANARGLGPANGESYTSVVKDSTGQNVIVWPQGHRAGQGWPYQVLLFPEGTVISSSTKERSNKYCDVRGIPRFKNVLLPRMKGLYLTLQQLRRTAEVVYDITCAYSEVDAGVFAEDIFTLKGLYLLGVGPKTINYYIRAWKLSDIPLGPDVLDIDEIDDEYYKKFENWLLDRWYEKDDIMSKFYKYKTFENPEMPLSQETVKGKFKIRHFTREVLTTFIPLVLFTLFCWGGVVFVKSAIKTFY